MNKFIILLIILICLLSFSCNKSIVGYKSYEDVEVDIKKITTRTFGDQNANRVTIEFTVENTDTITIEYWIITFNILLDNYASVEVSSKLRATTSPGEISATMSVHRDIPQFKIPTDAILKSFRIIE